MPDLEKFVNIMENLCGDDTHGYSQYHRYGPDYDCSSAVIYALEQAGWPMNGALTTDHIRAPLVAQGWAWLPPSVPKERGDILLAEEYHVAVVNDFLDHLLDSLFKFSAILTSCHHAGKIQR